MAQVFTVSLFEFGPEQNGVRFNYITRVQDARTPLLSGKELDSTKRQSRAAGRMKVARQFTGGK
jgi:hypothetical protein